MTAKWASLRKTERLPLSPSAADTDRLTLYCLTWLIPALQSVGVITKYNYQSLVDHFGDGSEWDLNRKNDGLFILPPFASGNTGVYKGKLEALNSALSFLRRSKYKYVLMCDSTVICNIDFEEVLNSHIKSGADITVVANKDYQNKNTVK